MIFEYIRSPLHVEVRFFESTLFGGIGDDRIREPFLVFEVDKPRAFVVMIQVAILDRVMSPAFAAENPLLVRRRTVNDRAFGWVFCARVWQWLALSRAFLQYEDL